MAQVGPYALYPPIRRPTSGLRAGLLPALRAVDLVDEMGDGEDERRWENGLEYRPEVGTCSDAAAWSPSCEEEDPIPTKPPMDATALVQAVPHVVYTNFQCSTWVYDEEERKGYARAALDAKASSQIGGELWKGTVAQAESFPNPYLAHNGVVTELTGTGEVSPLSYALASLQEALAECLGDETVGVIHANRKTVSLWGRDYQVYEAPDGTVRDLFGNLIVSSGGYDGSSPDGTVDNSGRTAWAYATGPVRVVLGPIVYYPLDRAEAIDRTINEETWYAERTANAHFDPCCLYGINVDLCNTCCDEA